jgi:hypothetical protein
VTDWTDPEVAARMDAVPKRTKPGPVAAETAEARRKRMEALATRMREWLRSEARAQVRPGGR